MSTLYLESVELASEVRMHLPRLMQKDQDLARRMKRSSDELTLHLEESMLATGRARRFELRAAEAALTELLGCARAAVGAGRLDVSALSLETRAEALRARLHGGSSEDSRRIVLSELGALPGKRVQAG